MCDQNYIDSLNTNLYSEEFDFFDRLFFIFTGFFIGVLIHITLILFISWRSNKTPKYITFSPCPENGKCCFNPFDKEEIANCPYINSNKEINEDVCSDPHCGMDKNSDEEYREIEDMFNGVLMGKIITIEDALAKGIEVGDEPILKNTGRYARIGELNDSSNFRRLEDRYERVLVGYFTHNICGMNYQDANEFVESKNYRLHPYIINGTINQRYKYSGNVVGVSIEDKNNFNIYNYEPSPDSKILSVVNIGAKIQYKL